MAKTEEFAGVDLSDFLPVDTKTLDVLRPGGVGSTGWTITFAGPEHPQTVAWSQTSAKKALKRAEAIEQSQINGKRFKVDERSVDEVRRENVAWVVARIVDWTPIRFEGKEIAFSPAAATELLARPAMSWALAQMIDLLSSETSFMKTSATA